MSGSDHVPIGVVIELRRPRLLREQYKTNLLKGPGGGRSIREPWR